MRTRIGRLALALLLVAACGPAAGGSAPAPTEVVISGGEWRATSIAGRAPVADHVPTIRFEDGRVAGSTGCNEYGAEVVVAGATIAVDSIVQTEMACMDQDAMNLEGLFTQALSQATTIGVVDGRLVISGPGGELVFVRGG